ncbi:hypothetical protein F4821DRAFT_266231 [Hypoxylon rubiginosum]|uniref:Uncharacterized protein n=1 Tax=Hypoxylon rubiginosum TaxID=110542 RepID=A0ACC0CI43_9PEZI|nr:hypothetical protein F4821DRAFT_266231 [Hypoxylon rubiginosum]
MLSDLVSKNIRPTRGLQIARRENDGVALSVEVIQVASFLLKYYLFIYGTVATLYAIASVVAHMLLILSTVLLLVGTVLLLCIFRCRTKIHARNWLLYFRLFLAISSVGFQAVRLPIAGLVAASRALFHFIVVDWATNPAQVGWIEDISRDGSNTMVYIAQDFHKKG